MFPFSPLPLNPLDEYRHIYSALPFPFLIHLVLEGLILDLFVAPLVYVCAWFRARVRTMLRLYKATPTAALDAESSKPSIHIARDQAVLRILTLPGALPVTIIGNARIQRSVSKEARITWRQAGANTCRKEGATHEF